MMKKRNTELIFTFDEFEWMMFQKIMNEILIGIDMQVELYDNGTLLEQNVSIVTGISSVSLESEIDHLMKLL